MADSYGLPPGSAINYGAAGFPAWVDELCRRWNLDSSTYPGHQESDRRDIGAAPNPQHLNRAIDWSGDPEKMLQFAKWCRDNAPPRTSGVYGPPGLEMVIFQDPRTGERVWYPSWVNYDSDFSGHRDHVHTRQSADFSGAAPPPPPAPAPLSRTDRYALAIIAEGRKRGISPRGIQIALTVPFVESGYKMYANSNVDGSEDLPHDAVGHDHDSTGLFQQRQAWGPLHCTMDPACSAGLFYDGGAAGQRGLTDFNYNDESRTPGQIAQAVQVSAFPDRYQQHWGEAVDLYNRLAGQPVPPQPQPPGEDDWLNMPTNQEKLDAIYNAIFTPQPAENIYRDPKDPVSQNLVDSIRSTLSMVYEGTVERLALLGERASQDKVVRVAKGLGPELRPWAVDRAKLIWAKGLAGPAAITQTSVAAISAPAAPDRRDVELVSAYTEIGRLREENARLQAQAATPVSTELVAVEPAVKTSGDHAAQLIDSVEEWTDVALSMDVKQRAALAASIKVLEMRNGAQQ